MKKIALKITIVFMLILAMCMGYVQATIGSDYNFGITAYRTDSSNNKYVYTFYPTDNKSGLKYIWNVQQYSNGIANTDEVFYCLSQGYGDFGDFTSEARPEEKPNALGGISPSSYSGPYRLKDTNVKNTLQALYSGTEVVAFNDDIYSGLLWILDNMYISGQDNKTEFLSKIQCTEDVEVPGMSAYTIAEAMEAIQGTDDDLSEFDIEIAQQLAIWTLTNNDTVSSFPSIYLAINDGTLKTYSSTYTGKDATKNQYNYGELRNFYVKMVYNYLVNGANSAIQSGYAGDDITTISVYANAAAQPVVSITREKEITGEYDVIVKKVDTQGNILSGAVFTVNGNNYTTGTDGTVTIAENIAITEANVGTNDSYSIIETLAPDGYLKYEETINLTVTKKESDDGLNYIIDTATLDSTSSASGHVTIDKNTNTITITVVNDPIEGQYTVKINKQNKEGTVLQGAVFTVNNTTYTTDANGNATIANNVAIKVNNVTTKDTYKITETTAPEGYLAYDQEIILEVTKKLDGTQYVIDNATLDSTSLASGHVTIEKDTNTIIITVVDDPIEGQYTVKINKQNEEGEVLQGAVFTVNGNNYTTDENGYATIANNVEINEANVSTKDTYKMTEIVAPEGYLLYDGEITLEVTKKLNGTTYALDDVDIDETSKASGMVSVKVEGNTITVIIIEERVKGTYSVRINKQNQKGKVLQGAVFTVNNTTYTTDENGYATLANNVEINEENVSTKDTYKITEITAPEGYVVYDGEIVLEVTKKQDGEIYTLDTAEIDETSQASNKVKIEINDKTNTITVIVIEDNIDLSLRKFISKVVDSEGNDVYTDTDLIRRVPDVKTDNLKDITTAKYIHTKQPVRVSVGDKVTYTIRVYNEGESDAYITEITDYLSTCLEYVDNNEWFREYGQAEDNYASKAKTSTLTTITGASKNLQDKVGAAIGEGILLLAYDSENDFISYIDVQITCEVLQPNLEDTNLSEYEITNIAEITGMLDRNKNKIDKDIDSEKSNVDLPKTEEEWSNYKKEEIGNKDEIPGQEDDDDFEKVIVQGKFDLALRKFITKVNSTEIKTRYPEITINDNGKIKYTHTKNPVEVCYQDTVVYTIRVYNEGEISGYANEITDDVPDGLEFIIDNEINKTYRWIMLDENQEVTEDVSKAKYLVTDYLSEEQGKATGRDNEIKAFDKNTGITETNPDYRDVQIAFKVNYTVTSPEEESRVLVNVAQISEDSNDDVDSKPSRTEEYDEDPEDDIDYENVRVKYFDLSLLKWVTQAIIVENGETSIIETGHTGLENPEPVVKVEIKSKDVNKAIVKFAYKIKITNEGEIAGYANEITDYIPEGLKFVAEDNPGWYERTEGVVATDLLKDTLLQPGESAEVEIILTWINGEKNLGTKINVAEISKDDNESDTPDIDSTPDNKAPEEDDIDDAPVMLVIKTGINTNVQYVTLGLIVMTILTSGIIAIKKFVLN